MRLKIPAGVRDIERQPVLLTYLEVNKWCWNKKGSKDTWKKGTIETNF